MFCNVWCLVIPAIKSGAAPAVGRVVEGAMHLLFWGNFQSISKLSPKHRVFDTIVVPPKVVVPVKTVVIKKPTGPT